MSTDSAGEAGADRERPAGSRPQQRKQVLLRLDPLIHDALTRWANDELRSANAQIEFLLRKALSDAGRLPRGAGAPPRRGRPPKQPRTEDGPSGD
ncbi:hypothetical protein GCM10010211_49520 [Streptomyces albospinus]|uniref:Toxin-antitoxin system HicB family antitoxin n=1 Tax=Streptomyces albospinus TaxID=285515 RepID=A0ABQ2VD20_9ACTN|nr:hypothetical protein [Streptomyces albospinus]GGU77689.1 hypothetical protein GCM10010211_49520 [Streptomyces albospinus]